MAAGGERRTILVAVLTSAWLAAMKFAAWAFTGSVSVLAEAVHSAANAAGLLLFRPNVDGGRQRYFWSFVVALVVFVLGAGFSLNRGIGQLRDPKPLDDVIVAVAVLGVGIIIEAFMLRASLAAALPHKGELTWRTYLRTTRHPELPVALLERFGTQVGLMIALGAIAMAELTGNAAWDGVGAMAVGLLLGVIAIMLILKMRSLLVGNDASESDVDQVRAAILSRPEVLELIDLQVQQVGSKGLLVAAKIELVGPLTVAELAAAVDAVERTIGNDVPRVAQTYIEPDLTALGGDHHDELPGQDESASPAT